ncbi:hypothetical protein V8E53_009103 [Lactarius tabidus]
MYTSLVATFVLVISIVSPTLSIPLGSGDALAGRNLEDRNQDQRRASWSADWSLSGTPGTGDTDGF